MSVQAIDWALRLVKNVTPTQKLILICLANHAGPDGDCWPSQTVVSDYSGLSRDAVNKNMKELESLGLIASERRKDSDGRETTKKYRLKMAESLGVVQDYTGGAEMRGRCSPELHPIKSTTNEEENDKSPDIAGCSPELHRGIGERHTGVVQNYTDCSPGLHKSFRKESSKEETKTENEQTYPPPPKTENRPFSQSVVFLKEEKDPSEELSTRLRNVGFSPKDANMILRKYPFDRISVVLEYATNKKPASFRGFVVKALSEEWSLSEDTPAQVGMDQYRTDLNTWKSFPYDLRRKYLNQGGFGSNSDYPEPGWLREVLEKIESEKRFGASVKETIKENSR
jgi:biotin operon repressor